MKYLRLVLTYENLKKMNIISTDQVMLHENKSVSDEFKKAVPDWNYAPQVSQYFCDFYKIVLAARVRSMVAKAVFMQNFESGFFKLLKASEKVPS